MNEERMIPCDHVIAQLWEYIDADLDGLRSEQVRRHLDVCARCFPEYDFRRAYVKFVRRCYTQQVPSESRRQIFQMVLEEERKVKVAGSAHGGEGVLQRARYKLQRLFGKE
jgi:anti-sigma factor (TIGR02949 family)